MPSQEARALTTPEALSFAIHRDGTAVVVAVHGELRARTADALGHILRDLICDQGNLHVAIDVGGVSDVDTTGVAVLVDGCRLARDHDATLALVNAPPPIEQALDRWRHEGMDTEDDPGASNSTSTEGTGDRPTGLPQVDGPLDQATLMATAGTGHEERRGGADDHLLELYVSEDQLVASVRDFLMPALGRGEAALVVATADHRRRFDEGLLAAGVDVDDCRREGRYVPLDARGTLAKFMVGEVPDGPRFAAAVGELVRGMAASHGGIRIYGEMVAVLWADGNVRAAVALEDLWNEFREEEVFGLLCAYPTTLFASDDATESFRRICDQHTGVIPSERTSTGPDALYAIALLEQRVDAASAARSVLAERNRELEETLSLTEELERSRKQFLAMVAHDIHALTAAVSGSLTTLQDNWRSLDERRIQDILCRSVENLRHLESFAQDGLTVETGRFSAT